MDGCQVTGDGMGLLRNQGMLLLALVEIMRDICMLPGAVMLLGTQAILRLAGVTTTLTMTWMIRPDSEDDDVDN